MCNVERKLMTTEEEKEYLKSVFEGKIVFENHVEERIAENFKRNRVQHYQLSLKINKLQEELSRARELLIQLSAKLDQSSQDLVDLENGRQ